MVSGALVELNLRGCQVAAPAGAEGRISVTRTPTAMLMSLAMVLALAGCATKPNLPPGVRPSVEVGPPPKSDTWKGVATAEDRDRLSRLDQAWQEALADASKTNKGDVR